MANLVKVQIECEDSVSQSSVVIIGACADFLLENLKDTPDRVVFTFLDKDEKV